MTANLKALVQKWRDEPEGPDSEGRHTKATLLECADELAREIERMESEPRAQERKADAERLNAIATEYLHVIPFAMPTGQGDADVGWEIRQSHMGKGDVVLERRYEDDLRTVIDLAVLVTERKRLPQDDRDAAEMADAAKSMFDDLYDTAEEQQAARRASKPEPTP